MKKNITTIVEAGHFYAQEGFSETSKQGWELGKECNWTSMLFIDDVHPESNKIYENDKKIIPVHIDLSKIIWNISEETISVIEKVNKNNFVNVDSPIYELQPEVIILEWEMKIYSEKVLEVLENLSRKKRARINEKWTFCSNIKIFDSEGTPTCVWYDLWLTYLKEKKLWATEAINILPLNYEEQQENVHRIYKKVNPNFNFHTLFFNPND